MESRMFDNHPSLCRSRHARFHHFFVLVIGLINDISMTELGLYLANKQGRGFQYKGILEKIYELYVHCLSTSINTSCSRHFLYL